MTDSFASGPNKTKPLTFQPKVIEVSIPIPRRKSSLAIMETRDNRFEPCVVFDKDINDEINPVVQSIANFHQKIKRIDTKEIELPNSEKNAENIQLKHQDNKKLDESVIISRLHQTHSSYSPNVNMNSDGTNKVSSNFICSSYRGTRGTGVYRERQALHLSGYKMSPSPENSISAVCDNIDFSRVNEHALQALLNESMRDREYLENKMQRVDTRIHSLQRSILEKSRPFSRAHQEETSVEILDDQKTVDKSRMIINEKPAHSKNYINRELVNEVLAESFLANRETQRVKIDTLTVKQRYPGQQHSRIQRVDDAPLSKNILTNNPPKKRHMIIKSGKEHSQRVRDHTILAGKYSKHLDSSYRRPELGQSTAARSFSINHHEERNKDQNLTKSRALSQFNRKPRGSFKTIRESFILD